MLEQRARSTVVVVDYGDPDGVFNWCRSIGSERLRAVKVHGDTSFFNSGRARNIGAMLGARDAEILCFVDADILLAYDWCGRMRNALETGAVLARLARNGSATEKDKFGTCAIRADVFRAIRGYDEAIPNHGERDWDLYRRAAAAGPIREFGEQLLAAIPHSDDLRVRFHQQKDLAAAWRENSLLTRDAYRVVNPDGFGVAEIELWTM